MSQETVKQYQLEERSLIARRAKSSSNRLNYLLRIMKEDHLSEEKKIKQDLLRAQIDRIRSKEQGESADNSDKKSPETIVLD